MHSYISSVRYTRALEATLSRLERKLTAGDEDGQVGLRRAREVLGLLKAEVATPAEAFDNLMRSIESRLSELERDAWRAEGPLQPVDHLRASQAVQAYITSFFLSVVHEPALAAELCSDVLSKALETKLLGRLTASFEADGKAGEYRSELTDQLLEELRELIRPVASEGFDLDLAPPETSAQS